MNSSIGISYHPPKVWPLFSKYSRNVLRTRAAVHSSCLEAIVMADDLKDLRDEGPRYKRQVMLLPYEEMKQRGLVTLLNI